MNNEYLMYTELLKQINFNKKLIDLKKKYANKKILLFGIGTFFDTIIENYNLQDYLDIVGVADTSFEIQDYEKPIFHKGFKTFSPKLIRACGADIVLSTTLNPTAVRKFLKANNLVRKHVKIENIIQESFEEKRQKTFNKLSYLLNIAKISKNPFKLIKYAINLSDIELETKLNYLEKITNLKKKTDKIRVMFFCENSGNWAYQPLFEQFNSDYNFKILPIIALPTKDENTQQKTIEFFASKNIEAIDCYDENDPNALCIKAFKPDIIFYQNLSTIKNEFLPKSLSKTALTCYIPNSQDVSTKEYFSMSLLNLQFSYLWRIFAQNNYYNSLKSKDVVHITESYSEIIENIKSELSLNIL